MSDSGNTAAIEPDVKDWTWVLERACPECGLETPAVVREDVAGMIRANAASWAQVLGAAGVRRRPAPGVWSALEYACHVRDVFRLFHVRLGLMLTQDGPLFADWDQDGTAVAERYGEQEPAVVAEELVAAAEVLAAAFDAVAGEEQWRRTGNRSDGARFTVESFSRYLVHDPVHHLYDVTGARHA
ncbi:DinB family protein [Streptomyces sp. SP17BM10]|uniref:DinB family protein n=1 Tax=Streptomyces sp. SP17BM10 TaxID=3002530 RepID=UPI002E75E71B|nr:DinB family protein [Streptomyces sp. SP17BM10]MEE1785949.1 DinB family protein [Streptomyces sp. SP17BM10]